MNLPLGSTIEISDGARPRLGPGAIVLSRGENEFQVGVDGTSTLVIPDRQGRLRTVLRELDGSRRWSTICDQSADQISPTELTRVLLTLAAAGLAELDRDPARPDPPLRRRIRLVGAATLGVAVGDLLLSSDIERLYVVDGRPAEVGRATANGGTRAEAFRERRRKLGLSPETRADPLRVSTHWTKPETSGVAVTVVAATELEVDRGLSADLMRADAPHLIVRPSAVGAVVGPLVVPGRTSCLNCADLARRDADPAWPVLLHQLSRRIAPVAPAVTAWAAAIAVTQVLSFLARGTPETVGSTVEISAPDFAMRWRSWPPHAGCGCHWDRTAQW